MSQRLGDEVGLQILVGNSHNENELPLRDRMEGEELVISPAVAGVTISFMTWVMENTS